jgi:phosphatidylinositol-3-phosphatase
MVQTKHQWSVGALTLIGALTYGGFAVHADHGREDRGDRSDRDHRARKVFVVAMENHNWTQPATTVNPQPIFQNPAAPFINGLVDGSSGISSEVAYATHYLNAGAGVHPSEPNYIWAEAGDNLGVFNDDNPYHADCSPDTVRTTDLHLSAFLTKAHRSWRSYQEDTDVDTTNTPLPKSAWTVPLFSTSGLWAAPGVNAYNYTAQFNYASKHTPTVFFTDTNGGCNTTPSNPLSAYYAPLQQLALDLQSDEIADYTWITPNQFNDMHTSLANGYGKFPSSNDGAKIAQGDNFLARVVPLIMASRAYKDHGVIVLWWDESEGGDTPAFTLPFIVISKDVRDNIHGKPFASDAELSHSSTLRTMQELFDVDPHAGYPWLGAAATATDLAALFKPGTLR